MKIRQQVIYRIFASFYLPMESLVENTSYNTINNYQDRPRVYILTFFDRFPDSLPMEAIITNYGKSIF